MKIPVILNGKKTVLDAEPSEKLITVLRRMKIYSVKCGCMEGHCGNCMLLLNDEPVVSCRIPVGIIRDAQIVTIEYFKNSPIYRDIIQGFNQAGMHLCGYCTSGKVFTAYGVLKKYYRPDLKQLYSAIKGIDCCCVDKDTFANGILYAVAAKHTRENKNSNAKK